MPPKIRQRPKASSNSSSSSDAGKQVETEKEREDREERELEEWCGKWCGRAFSMWMIGSSLLGGMRFVHEFATRPDLVATVEQVNLAGQTAVITGGCSGIGLSLADLFLQSGASLVLGCRNETAGKEAVASLLADLPEDVQEEADVEVWPLDLSSFASVRRFATRYEESMVGAEDWGRGKGTTGGMMPRELHMLVHNAGTQTACNKTDDGHDTALQVNYLSPFMLTDMLMEVMQRTQAATRIVHLTCPAMTTAKIDVDDLSEPSKRCDARQTYANSKMMVLMGGLELEQRLRGAGFTGITSNVVNPEVVLTDFHSKTPPSRRRGFGFHPGRIFQWATSAIMKKAKAWTMRSAAHGASAVYHVATSPALANAGGRLYSDTAGATRGFVGCGLPAPDCGRVAQLPKAAVDFELRRALEWERRRLAEEAEDKMYEEEDAEAMEEED